MEDLVIKDVFPPWLTVEWMNYDVVDCDAAYAVISAIDLYNDCAHVFCGPSCDFVLGILYKVAGEVFIEIKSLEDRDSKNKKCDIVCPPGHGEMACGFDAKTVSYKLFANKCAMQAYGECHNIGFFDSAVNYCIRNQIHQNKRRVYGESCPVFCPSHYRPVCAASKLRSYMYRAFNNGCYLDMVNCRGDEDSGFVEVGLEFCQKHLMKNIFKENVVVSRYDDYRDYHDY